MLANALVVTFISSFIAIAVFSHVLLIGAIWPHLFGKRDEPQPGPAERIGHMPTPN
jgi:hypothetical protein